MSGDITFVFQVIPSNFPQVKWMGEGVHYTMYASRDPIHMENIYQSLEKKITQHSSAHPRMPDSIVVNFPFMDKEMTVQQAFDFAHRILHAIANIMPNIPIEVIGMLVESTSPDDIWKWMRTLPKTILVIEVGLCNTDEVPLYVWEAIPALKKISVRAPRTESRHIGPETCFER